MKLVQETERRRLVWIVDDSALDRERSRLVLAGDFDVQTFDDGSAMLERLAGLKGDHGAPDVLVLDWVMPGISGIEVLRFLRSGPTPRPGMGILLLTTQTETEQIVEGLAAGANDYLVKPYADPELRARVDAIVRGNSLLERAQKAEASVLELLEHAPDPLISVDRANVITYANSEAQRALGEGAANLLGEALTDVLPTLSARELAVSIRHERPLPDLEVRGQIYAPTARALPSDPRGGLTIALRNVTVRREKEARRLDFYSMVAHDLRSPLSAMLMRTDLIMRGRRGVLSAELVADLRKMETHMRGLVALINDFLDLARLEEAPHQLEQGELDVAELINGIVEDFRPLTDSTQKVVSVEIGRDLPPARGDVRRLQQVVTNLVGNAIKFTAAGGHIAVRARRDGHWCEVSVEDNGPGIAPEFLSTLFKRYTRAPSQAKDVGGTGLGLLIVREIVEAHGGTVGVDSEPGRGSRFWFRIPAHVEDLGQPMPAALG